jgi:hypothetical protein
MIRTARYGVIGSKFNLVCRFRFHYGAKSGRLVAKPSTMKSIAHSQLTYSPAILFSMTPSTIRWQRTMLFRLFRNFR